MTRTPDTPPTTADAVVIGLELPGFAKLPVAAQCRQQEQLQRRLSAALQSLPPKDRIVLDTPAGAAVVLFTSAAAALNIACALCGTRSAESGSIALRAGLAMGPLKAVPDTGGQLHMVGEALEVAEQIVTLVPGERVVTTRAYADALRRELPACAPALRVLPKGAEAVSALELVAVQITHPTILAFRRRRSGQSKPLFGWLTAPRAAMAGLAFVLAGLAWTTVIGPARSQKTPARPALVAELTPLPEVRADIPTVDVEPIPQPETADSAGETPVAAPLPQAAQAEETPRPAKPIRVKRALRVDPARNSDPPSGGGAPVTEASIETPQVLASTHTEHGKVLLAIAPWGEVLVNGKSVGVSPPLTELELESGSHYLEVRNGTSAPLLRRIDVQGNETLKIRHRFADSH